ncbi:MAG: ABC transporter family substrate-binding protein, partial [Acidimicrobiales bacterium]
MRHFRRSAGTFALTLVLALVAGACGSSNSNDSGGGDDKTPVETGLKERAAGGTLVYGADQEPTGFNGSTSKDNGASVKNVIENIFYYAVKAKPDFTLDYVGLEGEPEVVGEDPQVVEWKIKKEAVWSDGTPVTVDDVQYYYEQTMKKDASKKSDENPDGFANDVASRVGYDQITKFEKVNDKTFRATFDPAYGDFRGLWFDIPQAAFMKAQDGGWDTGLDADPGPSAGPYKLKEWVKGQSLTLVPNEKWWGKDKTTLEAIIFRFLPESTTQPDALRNGEVDMIYPQPQTDLIAQVDAQSDVRSEVGFGPVFEHLTFNFKNEFLKDPAVRKAIAAGVDRNAIVEAIMKPFSSKAQRLDNSVIVITSQKAYAAHGKTYQKTDVAAAQKFLEDAGYAKGADGFYAKDGKTVSIRISTTSGNQAREQQGELIQKQLEKVGIKIVIDNSPSKVLFGERLPAGDFDIANFAWVGGVFPISGAKQIFETGSDSNYGSYSSAEFDKLAKEGAAELDETKQLAIANKMDEALWKDVPLLPLYQKPT